MRVCSFRSHWWPWMCLNAAPGQSGKTPLIVAASFGHLPVVEALLKRGADASLRDQRGKSALDLAKAGKHDEVANALKVRVLPGRPRTVCTRVAWSALTCACARFRLWVASPMVAQGRWRNS